MLGGVVRVDRDVLAFDGGLAIAHGEVLEVLEEPGLGGAYERGEARDRGLGLGLGVITEDALFQREGGARGDPLDGAGVALPRDQGLVVLGDVEDVALELALFEGRGGREGADPIPVAQAVAGGLGFRVSAGGI